MSRVIVITVPKGRGSEIDVQLEDNFTGAEFNAIMSALKRAWKRRKVVLASLKPTILEESEEGEE